jgi:cell division protein FtsB
MQNQIKYFFTAVIILTIVACNSKKDTAANLNDQKVKLEKLKSESSKNAADIKKLQDEIAKSDTLNGKAKQNL